LPITRRVALARRATMVSLRAIVEGVAIPREYGTESDERFRNRFAYLIRDQMNRVTKRRAAVVNTAIATR